MPQHATICYSVLQKKKYARKIKSLDAKCNIAHLAQVILRSETSFSYNIECCCGYTNGNIYGLLDVNIDIILRGGFQLMQKAINDNVKVGRSCCKCKKRYVNAEEHGSHLIIDTSVVTDDNYEEKQSTITVHTLGSIAKTVKVGQKSYIHGPAVKIKEPAHYGMNCAQPDMTTEEYEEASEDIIGELIKNQKNRVQIEKETHDQSNSMRWSLLRQNMITASSFGRICRAKTGYTAIVKDILYPN